MPGATEIIFDRELNIDTVQSDPLRLEIIINNLLSNAIKYRDDTKDKKQVIIKTLKRGHHCILEFMDNGIGIEKDHLNRIFEIFFVVDHAHNDSGLGLYIVKETVNKLNGTIRVESERGLGTKFIVVIPVGE
jgi:signal transduction histidine kinase